MANQEQVSNVYSLQQKKRFNSDNVRLETDMVMPCDQDNSQLHCHMFCLKKNLCTNCILAMLYQEIEEVEPNGPKEKNASTMSLNNGFDVGPTKTKNNKLKRSASNDGKSFKTEG